jgi:hypothetical protein
MKTSKLVKNSFRKLFALAAVGGGLIGGTQPASAQALADFYTLMLPPGLSLIANHLDHGANTIGEVLPVVPDGSMLMKWDEGTGAFRTDTYPDVLTGWVDDMGLPSTTTLGSREAAFFLNFSGGTLNLLFTGTARTPTPFPTLSRNAPHYLSRETKGTATWCELTGESPIEGAQLIRWNAVAQEYTSPICSPAACGSRRNPWPPLARACW